MDGSWATGSWDGWRAHIGPANGSKSSKANSFLSGWYHRVKESYVAAWFCRVFQTGRMSSGPGGGGGGAGAGSGGGAVGGALSLMGCVREASPPPQDHHPLSLGDFGMQRSVDTLPKGELSFIFHRTTASPRLLLYTYATRDRDGIVTFSTKNHRG